MPDEKDKLTILIEQTSRFYQGKKVQAEELKKALQEAKERQTVEQNQTEEQPQNR